MTQIAAIFDLDDTILTDASPKLIFRYMRSTGTLWHYFRRRDVPIVAAAIMRYRLGLLDATRTIEKTARVATGIEVDELWQVVRRWFEEMLVHAIAPAAQERLTWHRAEGHVPIICSAASQFSVRPVAEYLGIEHAICTEWLSDDGRLTGAIRLPVAYGEGKLELMRAWATRHNVDISASYFYSDHHSDRPLLEAVAHPVAVNPNRRLSRIAVERGWPIARWR